MKLEGLITTKLHEDARHKLTMLTRFGETGIETSLIVGGDGGDGQPVNPIGDVEEFKDFTSKLRTHYNAVTEIADTVDRYQDPQTGE